jgi:pyruvate/2-oxoglutarate/acetoin dehydrogenase E1 component
MTLLGERENSVFLGQAVACPGTSMTGTLKGVPREKLIELPVAEEMQMGMSIGISLSGGLPISIYPRWNFLLLATNQIVNHLDKLSLYSGYRPRVIIRTAIATPEPLDPGPQHLGDFGKAFRAMLKTVEVRELRYVEEIVPAYMRAADADHSTILVEETALYAP